MIKKILLAIFILMLAVLGMPFGVGQYDPADPSTGSSDYDHDMLTAAEEYQISTDPRIFDTDGDGMYDGWEAFFDVGPALYNPEADPDMDGCSNLLEFEMATHPRKADTDGDGLSDCNDSDPLFNPYEGGAAGGDFVGDRGPSGTPEEGGGTGGESGSSEGESGEGQGGEGQGEGGNGEGQGQGNGGEGNGDGGEGQPGEGGEGEATPGEGSGNGNGGGDGGPSGPVSPPIGSP